MEEKKIGKKRGPKGNWEELLEQYRKLPYSYQRVATDVLQVMINESNKTFSKKKEIRKLYHTIIRQEMQKKNITYSELYERLNEKEHLQLNPKTYESFRRDMIIDGYLFKHTCDILEIPYTEIKSKGKDGTDKSYIKLKILEDAISKTDTYEMEINVLDEESISKIAKSKNKDINEDELTHIDKKISLSGYYSNFLIAKGNFMASNMEWSFKLLNKYEKEIIEKLIYSLKQLAFDESTK